MVAAALAINPQRDYGAAVRVIVEVVPATSYVTGVTALYEPPREIGVERLTSRAVPSGSFLRTYPHFVPSADRDAADRLASSLAF